MVTIMQGSDDTTDKLQHDLNYMNINSNDPYAQAQNSTFAEAPSDPAPNPNSNATNVIVSNTQSHQFAAPSVEAHTPSTTAPDSSLFAYNPGSIFYQPQSNSTFYGNSPYASVMTPSEPSTPANGFPPTPNFLSPMSYNAYGLAATGMDLTNMIFHPWAAVAVDMIGSDITSDQAYQLAAAGSSHSSIPNNLAPIPSHQAAAFPFQNMTRNQYGAASQLKPARRGGGRRPREVEDVEIPNEDREKRDKRRQRNKEAAARCRQRRIDLMTSLQQQLDSYKNQNTEMERALSILNTQKMQCIQILQHHGCVIPKELLEQPLINPPTNHYSNGMHEQKVQLPPLPSLIAPQQQSHRKRASQPPQRIPVTMAQNLNDYNDGDLSVSPAPSSGTYSSSASSLITNNDPVISEAAVDNIPLKRIKSETDSPNENKRERPDKLPLPFSSTGWTQPSFTLPSITTPTNGLLNFGGESNDYSGLMNQSTGITPMVSQPMPVITSSSQPLQPPADSVLRQL